MAVVSLILGIISCNVIYIAFLFNDSLGGWGSLIIYAINIAMAVVGIVLAANYLKKHDRKGGVAKAGLIISIIGATLSVIMGVACVSCTNFDKVYTGSKAIVDKRFVGDDKVKYTIKGVEGAKSSSDSQDLAYFVFTVKGLTNDEYTYTNQDAEVTGPNGELEKVNPAEVGDFFQKVQTVPADQSTNFYLICKGTREPGVYTLKFQDMEFEFKVSDDGQSLIYEKKEGDGAVEATKDMSPSVLYTLQTITR